MGDIIEHTLKAVETADATSARDYVLKRYEEAIRYYWKASTSIAASTSGAGIWWWSLEPRSPFWPRSPHPR